MCCQNVLFSIFCHHSTGCRFKMKFLGLWVMLGHIIKREIEAILAEPFVCIIFSSVTFSHCKINAGIFWNTQNLLKFMPIACAIFMLIYDNNFFVCTICCTAFPLLLFPSTYTHWIFQNTRTVAKLVPIICAIVCAENFIRYTTPVSIDSYG